MTDNDYRNLEIEVAENVTQPDCGPGEWLECPLYSRDIRSAWLVVEAVDCFYFHLSRGPEGWTAIFGVGQNAYGHAESPALAICRAAMEAKKIEAKK